MHASVIACSASGSFFTANAAVTSCIYSNFLNDDSNTNGFASGAGDALSGYSPSLSFTPSANAVLQEVDFAASLNGTDGSTWGVTVTLTHNTPGYLSNVIASQSFSNQTGIEGSTLNPPGIIAWDPATEIDLVAGSTYWLTLSSSDASVVWNDNETLQADYDQTSGSNTTWVPTTNTQGAIAILTSGTAAPPAPEPGTLGLMLAASGAIWLGSSRLKSARG
jgi:hypothetical protein